MNKTILHLEASLGFGGQEIRILKESLGMRKRGYNVIVAASPNAKILEIMALEGFKVYEVPFQKKHFFSAFGKLKKIIKEENVDIINTHSSLDAWIGGITAKLLKKKVIRTRHLSTPIKKGINSYLLYNLLADHVITTCQEIVPLIVKQAKLNPNRCQCIATGLNTEELITSEEEKNSLRNKFKIAPEDIVVGTLCVLRSWKGISDFLQAANLMRDKKHIKWLIVGSGPSEERFKKEAFEFGLEDNVIFAGYQNPPFSALSIMDIFVLLSTANEGISQATLQASYFEKPLITTPTGGLKEVCIDEKTGFIVPKNSPLEVKKAVELLLDKPLREKMGQQAKELVLKHFTLEKTLDETIEIYNNLLS